jgi:hypothetical protein
VTLVALAGPERIDLSMLDDRAWADLRQSGETFECAGCHGPMHTRAIPLTNPLPGEDVELRIFAHNPGAAEACRALGYQESDAHDRLKTRIAKAARAIGWTAELEVQPSPACRADVVVSHPTNGRSRAIEAQLASLNTAEAHRRHKLYESEFGACTWTHTKRREWASQIPSLQVDSEDQQLVVGGILVDLRDNIERDPTPVAEVVPDLLEGRIMYVFDAGWGSYVLRSAASSGGVRRDRRRGPRHVSGAGAARFCERFRDLGHAGNVLIRLGLSSLAEFERLRSEAVAAVNRDHRSVTDYQMEILAAAYECPDLKVLDPRLEAQVARILEASRHG